MMFKVSRFCFVLLVMLALTFSSIGINTRAKAQTVAPEAGVPAGLNADDWAQIKAILPTPPPPYSQQAYFTMNNYANSVSVSGDTAVLGVWGADSSAGAVYVYTRSDGIWNQQAYLKASNANAGDQFGSSVAISNDTLVIGAMGEASNATGVNGNQNDNSASRSGAAYVFTRSGSTWNQQAYLKASNTGVYDQFGMSIAISGDTLVVGAIGEDSNATGINGNQNDNSSPTAGAAYIFTRNINVWSQQAYLKASNTEPNHDGYSNGDEFSYSVAISENTVVVGARSEGSDSIGVNGAQNNNLRPLAGAAYVFTRNVSNTWSQQAYLKPFQTYPGSSAYFGSSVSISGDTLIVGAPLDYSKGGPGGAAYVFTRSANAWTEQAMLKASNADTGDWFGWSVAVSNDRAVVGSLSEASNATGVNGNQTDNSIKDAGAVYAFSRTGAAWHQQAYLKSFKHENNLNSFGWSIAIANDTVAVIENANLHIFVNVPPPVVTSSLRLDANPITTASVKFKVSFSEPVSGVNASDFALTTSGGLSGAAVTNVSGGPTDYTVTVSTGSGSGTLRLDVVDDDSILSAENIPLGGAGAGNGNFTTGEAYTRQPPTPVTETFYSLPAQDGWILESSDVSGTGGTMDSAATTFRLGDAATNRPYRSILSFSTAALPDNAVITSAVLKIKQSGAAVGTNPFVGLGNILVDVRKGMFGTALLELSDFSAPASASKFGSFGNTPVNGVYSLTLNNTARSFINLAGATQFRLYFGVKTNHNNVADYLAFLSGNSATGKPELEISYTILP